MARLDDRGQRIHFLTCVPAPDGFGEKHARKELTKSVREDDPADRCARSTLLPMSLAGLKIFPGGTMRETQIKSQRGRSSVRILMVSAAFTLCALALTFAFAFALFYRTMDALIAQPIETFGSWIGKIDVEDHGGDYRIALPPTEDGAR